MKQSLRLFIVFFAILILSVTAFSQEDAGTPPHFFLIRGGTSSCILAVYTYNMGLPVLGITHVKDPTDDYREINVGVGLNLLTFPGLGLTIIPYASKATDSWYTAIFGFPYVGAGRVSVSGALGVYLPFEKSGVRQYLMDPIMLVRMDDIVAIGAAFSYYQVEGDPIERGIGPSIQVAIPHGSARLDALLGLTNFSNEGRLTVSFGF